jgi:effector-binding domain-containing protein
MNRFAGFTLTFVWVLSGALQAMAVEEADYEVIRKTNAFEIRDYAPHIVAETVVAGNLEDAGSVAFKILFGYISGDNRSRQDVEMTAPVSQQVNREKINMTAPVGQQPIGDKWVVSFMMPASYTMETLPVPEDPKVKLRQVPGRRMAVVRYTGFWSESGYLKNKLKLKAWIRENEFTAVGDPIWARYNPPFTPWFLRRNEILIQVAPDENQDMDQANMDTIQDILTITFLQTLKNRIGRVPLISAKTNWRSPPRTVALTTYSPKKERLQ